jgi:hypothetical protein
MGSAGGTRTKVAFYGQPRATRTPTPFGVPQAGVDGKIDSGWLGGDVPATVADAAELGDFEEDKLVLLVNAETQAHEVWQLRDGDAETDIDNGVVRSNRFSGKVWYRS